MTSSSIKPNFLIAGAARSGTTALCRILDQHPDVFITEPKEVHFFAHANRPTVYNGPGDNSTMNQNMVCEPDEFLKLFEGSLNVSARGEGSVSTLYFPDHSLPAIERYGDPDIKVVAILREPAARAYSSYLYLRGRGFEDSPSFDSALALEQERIEAGYHHMWHLRAMSRYSEQVPAFRKALGDRFRLIVFEEYRQEPDRHLSELCDFLGIDASHRFTTDIETNRGGEPRSRLVASVMDRARRVPALQNAVKSLVPASTRESLRMMNLSRPDVDQSVIASLSGEFEPDVACVEEALGRSIPSWRQA